MIFLVWMTHLPFCVSIAEDRRNTREFAQSARDLLYKTYVRSVLEYACTVWDPPIAEDKTKLEKVQNLAARYVSGNYARRLSMFKRVIGVGIVRTKKKVAIKVIS